MNDLIIDWALLRTFLTVAEEGSLTAAARRLGQSQPTTGRQIKAAEAAVGEELFSRNMKGLELTDFGLSLIEYAKEMAAAAAKIEHAALGKKANVSGTVRITCSIVVANYILPNIVANLRAVEPDVAIEIVPTDLTESLSFREADIAIRMYRPTQLDIISKHVTDQPLKLYAACDLANRLEPINGFDDLKAMPFVGFDKSDLIIQAMRELGMNVRKDYFGVRCDDQGVYWQLVCAGCGIGAMQAMIGDAEPLVQRLSFQPPLPTIPIWLAAPDAMRRNRRIRHVWDHLEAELNSLVTL